MQRAHLLAVAGGAAAALIYLWLTGSSAGGAIVGQLAPLPILLVGLSLGLTGALVASAAALVILVAAGPFVTAALFLFVVAFPSALLVRQALLSRTVAGGQVEWYPPGRLLAVLTGLALALFLAISLYGFEEGRSLEDEIREMLTARVAGASRTPQQEVWLQSIVPVVARLAPGIAAAGWLVMMVLNAVVAQWALARSGRALRPSPAFHETELHPMITAVAIACILAALLPGTVGKLGQNALIVVAVPFLLTGLAIIHAISVRWPGRGFLLFGLYLMLMLLSWAAAVIALIGLADPILQLRQRMRGPPRDEEDE